jgi:hypothetical protein
MPRVPAVGVVALLGDAARCGLGALVPDDAAVVEAAGRGEVLPGVAVLLDVAVPVAVAALVGVALLVGVGVSVGVAVLL